MKNNYSVPIALLLLMFFVPNAIGQDKDVELASISKVIAQAQKLLRETPNRRIGAFEKYDPETGKLIASSKTTIETVAPDRTRMISGGTDPQRERFEQINIKGTAYIRRNDSPWQVILPSAPAVENAVASRANDEVRPLSKIVHSKRSLGTETVGKLTFSVYEYRRTAENGASENDLKLLGTTRYWVRDDGLYAKILIERRTQDWRLVSRTTEVYEYDNIQIEAPTLILY